MAEKTRTGAPTWAKVITRACKLSRIPGFQRGLENLIGATDAAPILAAWEAFCLLWDAYLASDDYPFQIDYAGGEPPDIDAV